MKSISEQLENLKKLRKTTWKALAEELEIGEVMIHYLRKGQRQPSPKIIRNIEMMEARCGIRSFQAPSRRIIDRLYWYKFISQLDWPDIANRLGISEDEIEAVLRGVKIFSEEIEKLFVNMEQAVFITLPGKPEDLHVSTKGPLMLKESADVSYGPSTIGNLPESRLQSLEERIESIENAVNEILKRRADNESNN